MQNIILFKRFQIQVLEKHPKKKDNFSIISCKRVNGLINLSVKKDQDE